MAVDIEILAGQVVVGSSRITAWDYGMGVAGGDFIASEAYSSAAHATLLEGERAPQVAFLRARTMDGELIECEFVAINDWAESVGPEGREVELFGLDLSHYFGPEEPAD